MKTADYVPKRTYVYNVDLFLIENYLIKNVFVNRDFMRIKILNSV
jgi:hypothetical protein